jgi:penicillin amidase
MATIQRDSHSNLGARFRAQITAAVATIDDGTLPDVDAWVATLDAARGQRLRDAGARLAAWSFETPPAVQGSPSTAEIGDSVATTIFNAWGHFFMGRALGDEYARLDWNVYDANENMTARTLLAILEEPDSLVSGLSPDTGDPILCDHLDTVEIESCELIVLQSLDEALAWLTGANGLATDYSDDWRWGALHTLTLEPLFPDNALNLPPPNDPDPELRNGYPRAGDNFVVNRADCTWDDTDFSQDGSGPAQRMLVEVADGKTRARLAIPGGTIYDPSSPHFRDLMDNYYIPNDHFDVPFTTAEIVEHGEGRWVIRSK